MTTDIDCDDQNKIPAPITQIDGCPVLPKLACHEVQMGQDARLEWVMRTPSGDAVNLTDCANSCASTSGSSEEKFDALGTPECGITLRIRELTGLSPTQDPVQSVTVDITTAATGNVRAQVLPNAIIREPGIYLEEWALFTSDGRMLFSNQGLCFVKRGLFGLSTDTGKYGLGPPSPEEIRLTLRDSAAADNYLLDNVEFDGAEIAQAVLRPVQYWNDIPPPLRPALTTKTFPFKEIWLKGIQAYLYRMAANTYRRNRLSYNAGGVAVDDQNKEQEYAAAGSSMLREFQDMVQAKKVEINIAGFSGSVNSQYGSMFY
jgi:hypothetical protein